MKGLMILANGFEDVEALATLDVLRRSKLNVTLVSVNNTLEVTTQSNIVVKAEKLFNELDINEFDFLIIPGGRAVFQVLDKMYEIDNLINHFANNNKLVCAICAAPHLVGKLGHLKNKLFTCFPTCEEQIIGGTYLKDQGVVTSGNFITGKAMYYSFDFALAIIKHLQGEEQAKKVLASIKGEL